MAYRFSFRGGKSLKKQDANGLPIRSEQDRRISPGLSNYAFRSVEGITAKLKKPETYARQGFEAPASDAKLARHCFFAGGTLVRWAGSFVRSFNAIDRVNLGRKNYDTARAE
jgi:hypothetical protein